MIKNLIPLLLACTLFLSGCLAEEENLILDQEAEEMPIISDQGPDHCANAVKVVVWSDINADGLHDENEPPINGARIMLVLREGRSSAGLEGTTLSNGVVHFPTRELQDCNPHLYEAIFTVQFAGHEFPSDPVADLEVFDPIHDTVEFGIVPIDEDNTALPAEILSGCDVFSETEIVELIGPLSSAPMDNSSVGEQVGSFDGCIYAGVESVIILNYGPSPGIDAQAYFYQLLANFPDEAAEMLSGLGETAVWIDQGEFNGMLAILRGDIVITISVSGETPREVAEEIAPLAIERIP